MQRPEQVKLTPKEEDYVDKALSAGVGLLEIAHVLVLWRLTQTSDIPDPFWIQRQFTICKGEVQLARAEGLSVLDRTTYIPKAAREQMKNMVMPREEPKTDALPES